MPGAEVISSPPTEALRVASEDLVQGLGALYAAPPKALMLCVHGRVMPASEAILSPGSLVLASLVWYVNGAAVFSCGGLAYPVQFSVDGIARERHDRCIPASLRVTLAGWLLRTLWPHGLAQGEAADAGVLVDSVRHYQATYPMSMDLAPEDLAPAFAMWGTQALRTPEQV